MTNDLHHLAAAYALDALDPDERADFEAHYPCCDICRNDVVGYRATAAQLAVDVAEPPPELRDSVMAAIAQTRQLGPSVPEKTVSLTDRRRKRWAAVAAVAALGLLLAGFILLSTDSRSDVGDGLVALLASPDVVTETLGGDDGAVSVTWSAERGELVVVGSGLSAPGDRSTYELWLIVDDIANPSVLFVPDSTGEVVEFGEFAVDPLGWAVTVEPDGGSESPTGEILFTTVP